MSTIFELMSQLNERLEQVESDQKRIWRRYHAMRADYRVLMQRIPGRAAWNRGSVLRIPQRPNLLKRLKLGHDPIPEDQ